MDFRQLETFVEVANLKSFSKAAKKLFLTQPTVTNHIQNLEKKLGTMLINRSGKNISLTDAGNMLYSYSQDILNLRDSAEFNLSKYKGKIQGSLEISCSSVPKQYILPNILKEFAYIYPNVNFNITNNDTKKVVESILEGYCDFGIVGAKYSNKSLEYIELTTDRLIVATPYNENYPLNPYSELKFTDILNEKLLLREKGSGTRFSFENYLSSLHVNLEQLKVFAYISDNETIKRFIELGLGISIISELSAKKEIKEERIKPFILENFNNIRKFYFVYHKKRPLSPLAQEFKKYVLDNINNILK